MSSDLGMVHEVTLNHRHLRGIYHVQMMDIRSNIVYIRGTLLRIYFLLHHIQIHYLLLVLNSQQFRLFFLQQSLICTHHILLYQLQLNMLVIQIYLFRTSCVVLLQVLQKLQELQIQNQNRNRNLQMFL